MNSTSMSSTSLSFRISSFSSLVHLWWDQLDVDDDRLEAEVALRLEVVVVEVDHGPSLVNEGKGLPSHST